MEENSVKCPKCGSSQITAQKKGFSGVKAVGGALVAGGVGLLAGLHGSSDIDVTCLNCGKHWNPKKLAEQRKQEQTRKSIADHNKWKESFYNAYDLQDFDKAAEIYQRKIRFSTQLPDVHAAYKYQRKFDRDWMLIKLGFIAFIILLLVWILS